MAIHDGAPDIRVLWHKTHKARRPHLCDICNEKIAEGERYDSSGWREDGEFKTQKAHRWANEYPRGCPRLRAIDFAALEASDRAATAEDASVPASTGNARDGSSPQNPGDA